MTNSQNYHHHRAADRTYYDILGIPREADPTAIRKAYLRLSLKFHPDKNPHNREEEAKRKFIEIGEAYQCLRDPTSRRSYDEQIRNNNNNSNNGGKGDRNMNTAEDVYDQYRAAFDATVSGMTETELDVAVGTVTALAGLLGSVVGGRVTGGSSSSSSTTPKRGLLQSAGSMVGGYAASQIASSSVRALHRDSVNRISYHEDCQRALEHGQPLPPKPKQSFIGQRIGDLFQKTMDDTMNHHNNRTTNDGDGNRNSSSSSRNNSRSSSSKRASSTNYRTTPNTNTNTNTNANNSRPPPHNPEYRSSSNYNYADDNNNNNNYDRNTKSNSNHNNGSSSSSRSSNNNNNNNINEKQRSNWQENINQFGWNLASKGVKALQRNIDGNVK